MYTFKKAESITGINDNQLDPISNHGLILQRLYRRHQLQLPKHPAILKAVHNLLNLGLLFALHSLLIGLINSHPSHFPHFLLQILHGVILTGIHEHHLLFREFVYKMGIIYLRRSCNSSRSEEFGPTIGSSQICGCSWFALVGQRSVQSSGSKGSTPS